MSDSTIKSFISDNSNMFIKVSNNISNIRNVDDVDYSILNYNMILDELFQYLTGYLDYREKADNRYSDKVLSTTITFCDKMFTDIKYRDKISLDEFKEISHKFLVKTKELKTVLDNCDEILTTDNDYELRQLVNLINKQYMKISKVMKDDIAIYIWLSTMGCSISSLRATVPTEVLSAFNDIHSPVMHKIKRG